jgi:hypothetical protein
MKKPLSLWCYWFRRFMRGGPSRPGVMSLAWTTTLKVDAMNKTFYVFDVQFPPLAADSDVVRRELTYLVDDALVDLFFIEPGTDKLTNLAVAHDQTITLELVDVDEAGNRSQARVLRQLIDKDPVAPPMPGEFAVTFTEEFVADSLFGHEGGDVAVDELSPWSVSEQADGTFDILPVSEVEQAVVEVTDGEVNLVSYDNSSVTIDEQPSVNVTVNVEGWPVETDETVPA